MPRNNHRHERIHIQIHKSCIVIDWRVVEQCLPTLASNFGRISFLDLRTHSLFRGSHTRTAFSYLSTHLREIEQCGTSTALLDALEDLWKKDRQWRQRGVQSSISILQVFTALAQILSPEVFGCCETIFTLMSTFFTRHCEEIMRSTSPQWLAYVRALDLMDGGDPMPYISCLVQHQRDVAPLIRRACGRRNCKNGCLSDRTVNCLHVLFEQKNGRDHRTIAQHPWGRGVHGAMVIKDDRVGHRRVGGLRNGLDYHTRDLLEAREEGRVYVNESDGGYSDSSSTDDDYDDYRHHHHFLHGAQHHPGGPRRIDHPRFHNFPQHGRQQRLMHA